jgi:conjugative transfer signal peptidase TraF
MQTSWCKPAPSDRRPFFRRGRAPLRTFLVAALLTIGASVGCRALASRLTVNVTSSMPRGLYWLRPSGAIDRGSVVCLAVPRSMRMLVAQRRYLPPRFHLLKRVVALPGDHVCTDDRRYVVKDHLVSAVAAQDLLGRPLPSPYPFCGTVPPGVAFVAAAGNSSLDSRYFGPVPINALTPSVPLWTFF